MAPDTKGRVAWLKIMLIVAALLIATPNFAAERSVISECRWAEGPIVIDGKANEPAWKNAQVIDFKCVEFSQEFMYGHLVE